jgi:hypothetical protein
MTVHRWTTLKAPRAMCEMSCPSRFTRRRREIGTGSDATMQEAEKGVGGTAQHGREAAPSGARRVLLQRRDRYALRNVTAASGCLDIKFGTTSIRHNQTLVSVDQNGVLGITQATWAGR